LIGDGAEAATVTLTTKAKLLIAAAAYGGANATEIFAGMHQIEHLPEPHLRAMLTADSPLAPAATALKAAGIDTGATIGQFVDAIGIRAAELHGLVCDCEGDKLPGETLGKRVSNLATYY
jgi:hypothetical protein